MRKTRFLLILLALCFLLGCSNTVPEGSQPPSANETTENTEPQMPDETEAQTEKPNIKWMPWAGTVMVDLKNSKIISQQTEDSWIVYADPGDVIQAKVRCNNDLDVTVPCEFMVFADGLPMEFTVDGKQYQSYHFDFAPDKTAFEITFEKKFDLNLGRLDFVISSPGNPQAMYHSFSYPIWVDLDTEPVQPTALFETVEQREGVEGCFGGGAHSSWLWNEDGPPDETYPIGPKKISFREGETAVMESIISKPGLYRTVLIVNGDPVSFASNGEEYFYLDWESTDTNMLQLPVEIENLHLSGSFYTVTTPLDTEDRLGRCAVSWRTELLENGEE